MDYVSFFVPGYPAAKGRPKFVRATGRVYTPAETEKAEDRIRTHAALAMNGRVPVEQPVEIRIIATYLPPKTRTKATKQTPWASFKPSRPDCDNIAKLCADAMNGIVFRDDALVATMHVAKVYGETPGIRVSVHPLSFVSWPFCTGLVA